MNKALFRSKKQDWETPDSLMEFLEKRHGKMFDPCPINPDFDGLKILWQEICYVNPPYNEAIKWMKKGVMEWKRGCRIIFLLPARTDTKLFHDYVMKYANNIWLIKGRLTFKGAKASAPFPSMVVEMFPQTPYGPFFRTLTKRSGVWELQ